MNGIADLLNLGSGHTDRSQVPKNQVVLCSIGLELVSVTDEDLGHGGGVGSDLLGVSLESWVGSLLERNGDTGDGLELVRCPIMMLCPLTLLWGPP